MLTNAPAGGNPFRSLLQQNGPLPSMLMQKVVIVNGNSEVLHLLETLLEAGHYDVVFVESTEHAYSQIKRVQPNLVILCVQMNDLNGFQVLSMLKIDAETRDIPVLTYTVETGRNEIEEELQDPADAELFAAKTELWMN